MSRLGDLDDANPVGRPFLPLTQYGGRTLTTHTPTTAAIGGRDVASEELVDVVCVQLNTLGWVGSRHRLAD